MRRFEHYTGQWITVRIGVGNRYRHGRVFLRRLISRLHTRVVVLACHSDRHRCRVAQPLWVTHLVTECVDPGKVRVWYVIHRVIHSPLHRSMRRRIDAIARKIGKRVVRVGDRK